MKTKELIRQLQECDPTGEVEVVCDGGDIFTVINLPAYYDGSLKVLIRDDILKASNGLSNNDCQELYWNNHVTIEYIDERLSLEFI